MKKLYTFSLGERALAGLFRNMLQKEGIDCLIRNEQLFAALGEIPFVECFPELWIIDDEVYPRAENLLRQWMQSDTNGQSAWTCTTCGETSEGQFSACWQCGMEREED